MVMLMSPSYIKVLPTSTETYMVMDVSTPPKESASVFLGADLRLRLEDVAQKERRTLSQVIRLALEDWLDANHPQ
jgi:hypothetical protein